MGVYEELENKKICVIITNKCLLFKRTNIWYDAFVFFSIYGMDADTDRKQRFKDGILWLIVQRTLRY